MAYKLDKNAFKGAFKSQAPGFRQSLRDQGFSGQDLRDRLQGLRGVSRTASRIQGRRPGMQDQRAIQLAQQRKAKTGQLSKGYGFDANTPGATLSSAFQGFNPGIIALLKRLFGGG